MFGFAVNKKEKNIPIKYHRNCDTLPIAAFHKIMSQSDYRYLVIGWNHTDDIEFDREEAAKIWGGIYNEYCKLTNNNKALMYYKTAQRLIYLETRREVGARILSQFAMRKMPDDIFNEYIDSLKGLGFQYNKDKFDITELESLSRQIRAAENEIGLLRSELKAMTNNGEAMPFERELVKVEQALGRNMIDPWKTSVTKWHYLIKEIEEISEQRRKQLNKRK